MNFEIKKINFNKYENIYTLKIIIKILIIKK